MKHKNTPISIQAGKLEIYKVNGASWDWRDLYHWVLGLRWSEFMLLLLGLYGVLNVVFAFAYWIRPGCIAELPPSSFQEAFFFSIETLATVGYGHMYPATAYGHIIVSLETVIAIFCTAMMTGVIFVRFSRPTAKIIFSRTMVITNFNGRRTLMVRVANGRHQTMVETHFRIMMHHDEQTVEHGTFRKFHTLKLAFDHLTLFPAALTLMHVIDESSPLDGLTKEDIVACDMRFVASIVGVDTVIPAAMQSQQGYDADDIRFGERFVEIYAEDADGRLTVDYGRLHDTEPE